MSETLRVERRDLHEAFANMCPEAPLPWSRGHGKKYWHIVDRDNATVCRFDERCIPDAAVTAGVIEMIVVAVNTCGGYRAEIVPPRAEVTPL